MKNITAIVTHVAVPGNTSHNYNANNYNFPWKQRTRKMLLLFPNLDPYQIHVQLNM